MTHRNIKKQDLLAHHYNIAFNVFRKWFIASFANPHLKKADITYRQIFLWPCSAINNSYYELIIPFTLFIKSLFSIGFRIN